MYCAANAESIDIENVQLASDQPTPERATVTQERAAFIKTAVLSLPKASRSVIILREYEGFSYREIADTLDIPIGTVMSRLNYARKQLRQSLAPLMEVA